MGSLLDSVMRLGAGLLRSAQSEGKSHHMAVRALAFKWMRILYRCWKHREIYREDVYLASLTNRSIPFQTLAGSVQMQ